MGDLWGIGGFREGGFGEQIVTKKKSEEKSQ